MSAQSREKSSAVRYHVPRRGIAGRQNEKALNYTFTYDVDEDGIPDYIESDPYNVTDNATIEEYVKTHNKKSIKNQFNPLVRENILREAMKEMS